MYLKEKKASKEIYESNLVYIDEEITGEVDDEGFCKPIKTEIKVKNTLIFTRGKTKKDNKFETSIEIDDIDARKISDKTRNNILEHVGAFNNNIINRNKVKKDEKKNDKENIKTKLD